MGAGVASARCFQRQGKVMVAVCPSASLNGPVAVETYPAFSARNVYGPASDAEQRYSPFESERTIRMFVALLGRRCTIAASMGCPRKSRTTPCTVAAGSGL